MDLQQNPPPKAEATTSCFAQPSAFSKFLLTAFEYMEILALSLIIILSIYGCGVRICSVSGGSMLPTLKSEEKLLVSGIGYQPEYGDIVVFHQINDQYPGYNEPIIKRVIATEGQHVVIDFKKATVTVDGTVLEEPYIGLYPDQRYHVTAEHHYVNGIFDAVVPPGCVFLMGDNRNGSMDSRSVVISFVDERRILGEVIVRLTPTEAFGPVD